MNALACALVVFAASDSASPAHGSGLPPAAADLRSDVTAVRAEAARRLGESGEKAAVPSLIDALRDPQPIVRRAAARALGQIKDGTAADALREALGDADANVRAGAAYALGEIKDPRAAARLVEALGDPAWAVRDQAAWALREIADPQTARTLIASLKQQRADAEQVVWILGRLDPERAAASFAGLLEDNEPGVRRRAIEALAMLRTEAAFEPLLAALGDGDAAVRRAAVEALGKLGDARAKKPLRQLVARENDPAVGEVARAALAELSFEKHLAAHWSFDGDDGKIARDVTGRGNDGQIVGCTPAQGKVGRALRFAEGEYVELGKPGGLPIAQRPFTVMAWTKTDAADGVVVARGGAFCGYSLYVKDGTARFGIHREEDGPGSIAAAREKLPGGWVHLAGVVRDDRIELYVNGKLAASEKTAGYVPSNCGQGMAIGFDTGNSPAEITDPFQGIIDEVKVYHAALSEDEIAEAGQVPSSKGGPRNETEPAPP